MVIWLTTLLAIGAALLFAVVGYLVGVRKGEAARKSLRQLNRSFAKEIVGLRGQTGPGMAPGQGLQAALEDMLRPLVQRERLSYEMSRLDGGTGAQRDLTATLDQMAAKGNFSSVLLCDEQGWRIGASSATADPDRLAATASLLLLLADRMARDGAPAPLSMMLYDAGNCTTLCRIFTVDNHRMTLTVVASGAELTPAAIDPALARLNAMLLHKEPAGAATGSA
ncbi:MAG: hypothetical protein U1E89_13960 [Burkholderiaceae bacterium]